MLNETEANLIDIDDMPTFSIDTPREVLHQAIAQLARQARAAGYQELAHYMDIAAMILQDQKH